MSVPSAPPLPPQRATCVFCKSSRVLFSTSTPRGEGLSDSWAWQLPVQESQASLMFLFLLLALLIVLALGWCMFSSCIGAPLLSALSEIWRSAVASSRLEGNSGIRRRRTDFGTESEIWEMEARGRGG